MPTIPSHQTVRMSLATEVLSGTIPGSSSYTRFLVCKTGEGSSEDMSFIAVMGTGVEAAVPHTGKVNLTGAEATASTAGSDILQVELMAPAIGGLKFNMSANADGVELIVSMWGSVHSQGLR